MYQSLCFKKYWFHRQLNFENSSKVNLHCQKDANDTNIRRKSKIACTKVYMVRKNRNVATMNMHISRSYISSAAFKPLIQTDGTRNRPEKV